MFIGAHTPNVGNNGGAPAPVGAPPSASSVIGASGGARAATSTPLDAEYHNQLNLAQFQANAQMNALRQQGALDLTNRDVGTHQLDDREPILEQQATRTANARGLLYGGALGSQIGDLKTAYAQAVDRLRNTYAQAEAKRTSDIGDIQQGLPFEELALRLASIDRAAKAAQTTPLVAPAGVAGAALHARGHSARYAGPGFYQQGAPANDALRAVGHSGRYRGPGHYVKVTR